MAWLLSDSQCTVHPGVKISLYKMVQQIHYFIFITLCLVQVAFCQSIQLLPYNETKNCNICLVEEKDRIVMYGKVDFNGNIMTSSNVNIEIKRKTKTSFISISSVKIPEDCNKEFYYGNCLKTDDRKVFIFYLNITAHKVTSEADIRAELVYREISFYSETRKLPLTYDSHTEVVGVYANDQLVHVKQTNVLINDIQVTILATCHEKFAQDCKLQLTDLETGILLKSGKEIVVYITNIKGRSNFQLKYSVCNIQRNISFSITTNKTTGNLHMIPETNTAFIILSTIFILTLAIIFCCFFIASKKKYRRKIQRLFKSSVFAYKKLKAQNSTDHCFPQDKRKLNGDHDTQESEGGEANLHKFFVDCEKNPGHRQFIPVDTFTLKHLPEGLQDNDLYEYIKAIADLTVKVDVRMSSPDRPKFYPKTTQPYPFYNMRERRNLRKGSGIVCFVNKFQDAVWQDGGNGDTAYRKCWCRKCKYSDSPSNVWWELDVTTATNVVFDDIEADHTTLRLFYDRDDSLVVSVDKVSVVDVNIEYDLCKLKCVTCDETLGNKLMEMWKHFRNVWKNIRNKYKDSRSEHKFTFIVSHPHGCSKQVSVGQWKDILEVDDRSKFTYTTCTCPGSSGAHVNCLGYSDHRFWSDLVHSGSLKPGLNYSGAGYVL